uniref:Uncharacterized protein n=1 Tax=Oryza glumipatula TaxID=40148 RepID=A0A0D9YFK2_9ORYZ
MRNSATPGAVGELAELVLPWLPPQDLAAAASASRALRAAASSVSAGRAADAAHGLEPHPIPFDNLVDGKPYAYFLYTPFSLTPSSASASPRRAQPWGRTWARPPGPTWPRSDLGGFPSSGCACAQGACGGARGCPCADPEAEAVGLGSEAGMGSLRECGDGCACGPLCGNRRTQLGVTVRLRVVRHREKGWGLHAAEVLRRRQFVCEYAGELLTTEEARRRQGLYDELASVSLLQGQLSVLESQLFNLRVALASAHPDTPPQHFVVLQPAHSAASTPNQVVVNYDDLPHAVDFMDAEPAALRGLESLQLSQPLQREEDEGHRDMNLFSDKATTKCRGFGSHTIKVLEVLIDEISWAQSKSSAGDQRKALLRREG